MIIKLINIFSPAKAKYFRNEKGTLGKGGYGVVYSGTMVKGNQIFPAAFKTATKFSEREQRIKDLNHQFVVKFYGLYKEGDVEYESFQTRLRY